MALNSGIQPLRSLLPSESEVPAEPNADFNGPIWHICNDRRLRREYDKAWGKFRPYADAHFAREFRMPEKLNQRVWEMYVCINLLRLRRSVASDSAGPDIRIHSWMDQKVGIECVAASQGNGRDAVKLPPDYAGVVDPYTNPDLRVLTVVAEKANKGIRWKESGVLAPDEAYVIAINAGDVELANIEFDLPRIFRLAFGFGRVGTSFVINSSRSDDRPHYPVREAAPKRSAAGDPVDVPARIFGPEKNTHISAVALSYSTYQHIADPIGPELTIVHNPYALVSLPRGLFGRSPEWIPRLTENGLECRRPK